MTPKEIAAQIAVMGYRFPGERVIVVRDEAADKSEGGIILPDEAKRKPIKGTVVAMSEILQSEDDQFKSDGAIAMGKLEVLDKVIFTKYNPTLIELRSTEGERMEVEVMHPSDIYVIM